MIRPGISRRRTTDGSRDSRVAMAAIANVTIPTGTLMKKIQPQCRCWLMKPPISGPNASAIAPIAVQAPIAVVRSRTSVKVAMMIASVVGTTIAAPRPCTSRAPISTAAAPGQARAERGQREDRQADQEEPAPAVEVGQPAPGQQQPGENQDVAADDPFQARERQMQAALDGRDRDVGHVVVEVGHESSERHRHQGPPASGHGPGSSPVPRTAFLYVRSCTSFLYVVYGHLDLYGV